MDQDIESEVQRVIQRSDKFSEAVQKLHDKFPERTANQWASYLNALQRDKSYPSHSLILAMEHDMPLFASDSAFDRLFKDKPVALVNWLFAVTSLVLSIIVSFSISYRWFKRKPRGIFVIAVSSFNIILRMFQYRFLGTFLYLFQPFVLGFKHFINLS